MLRGGKESAARSSVSPSAVVMVTTAESVSVSDSRPWNVTLTSVFAVPLEGEKRSQSPDEDSVHEALARMTRTSVVIRASVPNTRPRFGVTTMGVSVAAWMSVNVALLPSDVSKVTMAVISPPVLSP